MSPIDTQSRITPFLWFDNNAEEAVNFYLTVFKNSRRLDSDSPRKTNAPIVTIPFELDGQRFTALNGGPAFKFNEAVSFVVSCESQDEVDAYWVKLTEGGKEGRCGWLKDRFGLSWQIVPTRAMQLLKSPKAMQALMSMTKIDISALERAASEA